MSNRLRNERIEIRVSPVEKEMIKQRMEVCHETNMGRYMRRMAIDGCIFNVDYSDLKAILHEINKIGVNINQIAHKVNSTGNIHQTEIKEIKEMLDTIWQLQRSILSEEP